MTRRLNPWVSPLFGLALGLLAGSSSCLWRAGDACHSGLDRISGGCRLCGAGCRLEGAPSGTTDDGFAMCSDLRIDPLEAALDDDDENDARDPRDANETVPRPQ